MLRRSFMKFAAVAVLHPVLNWQTPPFSDDFRNQLNELMEECWKHVHYKVICARPSVHGIMGG